MKAMATILTAAIVAAVVSVPAAAGPTGGGDVKMVVVRDGNTVRVTRAAPDKAIEAAKAASVRTDRPHIGIHVSPVPAAVASHLRLKAGGVMVRNVAKNSPADKAGLERYDVIVSISVLGAEKQKDVPVQGVDPFIKAVGARKVGETLKLGVIRGGRKRSVEVTLGKPLAGPIEYKYADDPDDEVLDELRLHRGMMRRKNGTWVLDTPEGMSVALPKGLLKALPERLRGRAIVRTKTVGGDANGDREISVTSVIDGRTLSFRESADGKITVTRTDRAGKREETVYDDADQLKAKDAEAYELYRSVTVWPMGRFGGGVNGRSLSELGEDTAKAAEEFSKQLDERIRKLAEQMNEQAGQARQAVAKAVAPVTRKFDVDEKGRIRVQVLKDGNELNMTFANEAEMKAKQPLLYKEYRKIIEGK